MVNNSCILTHMFPLPSLADHSPSKRQRTDRSNLAEEFRPFWNKLWNENVDLISTEPVVRDSNPIEGLAIPSTIRVFRELPEALSSGPIFIRSQYDDAYEVLQSSCASIAGVVITGHPGIGETKIFVRHWGR